MTYGKNYSRDPTDLLIQIGTDQVNLLEKIDKKLFVVIKKLEESEPEESAFPRQSRKEVASFLDGIPQIEDSKQMELGQR